MDLLWLWRMLDACRQVQWSYGIREPHAPCCAHCAGNCCGSKQPGRPRTCSPDLCAADLCGQLSSQRVGQRTAGSAHVNFTVSGEQLQIFHSMSIRVRLRSGRVRPEVTQGFTFTLRPRRNHTGIMQGSPWGHVRSHGVTLRSSTGVTQTDKRPGRVHHEVTPGSP